MSSGMEPGFCPLTPTLSLIGERESERRALLDSLACPACPQLVEGYAGMTDSGIVGYFHHDRKRQRIGALTGHEIIGMHSFFDKTGKPLYTQ